MGVERLVRRALWRLVFWRVFGDVVAVPRRLLEALYRTALSIEVAVFYVELDAARRYESLSGLDVAKAAGDEERYEGVRA